MQVSFSPEQLEDTQFQRTHEALRRCVHCGLCTATCPTFVMLGDERDSPRGRIYMIKEMFEQDRKADLETVTHLDRCLTCLSCTTTCPAEVDYAHLVDHARAHIEKTWRRPFGDRLVKTLLLAIVPRRHVLSLALVLARHLRALRILLPRHRLFFARIAALFDLADPHKGPQRPKRRAAVEPPAASPGTITVNGRAAVNGKAERERVALFTGCAEDTLRPEIAAATRRLLERAGYDVVTLASGQCCGAMAHHTGRHSQAHKQARALIDAADNMAARFKKTHAQDNTKTGESEDLPPFSAVIFTASGCGAMVQDYRRNFPEMAGRLPEMAVDICTFLHQRAVLGAPVRPHGLTIACQSACALQHGQKIRDAPRILLENAGYDVRIPAESHLCCGSAGLYNILQPRIASALRSRKLEAIKHTGADIIASGNIGCMTQLAGSDTGPVVHNAELLDWAYGGPCPPALEGFSAHGG